MLGFFKPGEIAYIRNSQHPELNGLPVQVVKGLGFRTFVESATNKKHRGLCYVVRTDEAPYGKSNLFARAHQLTRKKKPEPTSVRNKVVSWDDCAWRPKQIEPVE